MSEDWLALTTYFGERHRTAHGLLADELLALYGRHAVEISMLMRGVEGFGRKHHLRTDRLLTLSEDLPVVSVAVDTPGRITGLLDELLRIKRHGLLTLERARMLRGGSDAAPAELAREAAAKLTVYVGRQQRVDGVPAFVAVCDLLRRRGLAGATALLGVDGTVRGVRERARFFARNAEVPMMIVAVGSGARIAPVLAELRAALGDSPLTLERVTVCKREGELLARPAQPPQEPKAGATVHHKLTVYSSQRAAYAGSPLHVALIRALRAAGVRGGTSVRGMWGFHGDHPPHGDRLLQLRRHVPVVSTVIESPERVGLAFDIIDELTSRTGLVTSELVPAIADLGEGGGAALDPGITRWG